MNFTESFLGCLAVLLEGREVRPSSSFVFLSGDPCWRLLTCLVKTPLVRFLQESFFMFPPPCVMLGLCREVLLLMRLGLMDIPLLLLFW